ncbi:radical SAM protein, partial [Novosphingobium sp.]|uniref:radical SAM protein n=1 Tax=Novosphingobium sp. TaxID=1874826 RepID=UPI002616A578
MTATRLAHRYRSGEIHEFRAQGADFIYLVTAGAIFAADDMTRKVLDLLGEHGEMDHDDLVRALVGEGVSATDAEELVRELRLARAIQSAQVVHALMPAAPPADYPLQALVLNVTNQCNLACTYCYEFGADKIATPAGKPKYMSLETAKSSVDFLLKSADRREAVHITFFGGETLMNFRLLRDVVLYADEAAKAAGKRITYSLTTNATLLTDEIIAFLSDHVIGVTVSMDGPPELQDARRVYKNGKGSYAVMEPRLRKLIAGHKTRAVTARVTLSAGVTDVKRIYQHLKHDIGFHEVGFAPVTTAGEERDYALDGDAMTGVLADFEALADEWLDYALQGKVHGFTNVSETISELIAGT